MTSWIDHGDPEDQFRLPDGHRDRLAATIRAVAQWRREKAYAHRDDKMAHKRSMHSFIALKELAKYVETLPEDDPDLGTFRYSTPVDDSYRLSRGAWDRLSRFGMSHNVHGMDQRPGEAQMRNALRRAEGMEQQHRHLRRELDDPR
jgi:hypothetical protein